MDDVDRSFQWSSLLLDPVRKNEANFLLFRAHEIRQFRKRRETKRRETKKDKKELKAQAQARRASLARSYELSYEQD